MKEGKEGGREREWEEEKEGGRGTDECVHVHQLLKNEL